MTGGAILDGLLALGGAFLRGWLVPLDGPTGRLACAFSAASARRPGLPRIHAPILPMPGAVQYRGLALTLPIAARLRLDHRNRQDRGTARTEIIDRKGTRL